MDDADVAELEPLSPPRPLEPLSPPRPTHPVEHVSITVHEPAALARREQMSDAGGWAHWVAELSHADLISMVAEACARDRVTAARVNERLAVVRPRPSLWVPSDHRPRNMLKRCMPSGARVRSHIELVPGQEPGRFLHEDATRSCARDTTSDVRNIRNTYGKIVDTT